MCQCSYKQYCVDCEETELTELTELLELKKTKTNKSKEIKIAGNLLLYGRRKYEIDGTLQKPNGKVVFLTKMGLTFITLQKKGKYYLIKIRCDKEKGGKRPDCSYEDEEW